MKARHSLIGILFVVCAATPKLAIAGQVWTCHINKYSSSADTEKEYKDVDFKLINQGMLFTAEVNIQGERPITGQKVKVVSFPYTPGENNSQFGALLDRTLDAMGLSHQVKWVIYYHIGSGSGVPGTFAVVAKLLNENGQEIDQLIGLILEKSLGSCKNQERVWK